MFRLVNFYGFFFLNSENVKQTKKFEHGFHQIVFAGLIFTWLKRLQESFYDVIKEFEMDKIIRLESRKTHTSFSP